MSDFDMLPQFMMGIVIVGIIAYTGVIIMSKVVEAPGESAVIAAATAVPTPDVAAARQQIDSTISDAFGWVSIIIVALAAVMVLGLLFSVFGSMGDYSSPEPVRTVAKAPEPVREYVPTLDEQVANDPEIQALERALSATDYEIEKNKEELKQYRAGRGLFARLVLWSKHRS